MKKRRNLLRILIILAVILLLFIVFATIYLKSHAAIPKTSIATITSSLSASPTQEPSLIDTIQITVFPSPTPTTTPTPDDTPKATESPESNGFLLYSQADGLYYHLFVSSLNFPSPLRINDSNWDEIDPAVSPDGSKIAYSSKRNAFWDIYVLDLSSNTEIRITNSPEYDGQPTWSSDGQWLAYDSYVNGKLSIFIRSFSNLTAAPIQLTENNSDNFSPVWAPAPGREIAFVSNRTGDDEIWVARLDQVENRFINISNSPRSSDTDPAFSPDGRSISWTSTNLETKHIVLVNQDTFNRREFGFGEQSTWKKDNAHFLTVIDQPNSTVIAEYSSSNVQDPISFTSVDSTIRGIQWIPAGQAEPLRSYLSKIELQSQPSQNAIQSSVDIKSRLRVVPLDKVNAPYPYLINDSIKSFSDLRGLTGHLCGWDFLANLESAYLPLSEPPAPGMDENWLFTGRAIQVNSLPLEAGWMVISREDFNGQTFWRVYLKALKQDGSQGMPLKADVWDLDARHSGDTQAYENGGKWVSPPSGYWVDFTEIALRLGWKRVAALPNWRTYYPAARFNLFVNSDDLDWQAAMDQLYPPEALQTPTPFPTSTP